jgi:hypothetical protein
MRSGAVILHLFQVARITGLYHYTWSPRSVLESGQFSLKINEIFPLQAK